MSSLTNYIFKFNKDIATTEMHEWLLALHQVSVLEYKSPRDRFIFPDWFFLRSSTSLYIYPSVQTQGLSSIQKLNVTEAQSFTNLT